MKYIFSILFCTMTILVFYSEKSFSINSGINKDTCTLNSETIENFIIALMDTNMVIGLFKSPDWNDTLRYLRNGKMPEMDDNYIKMIIKYNLIKLDKINSIQGNLDNVIFLKYPMITSKVDYYENPELSYGSKWILLLKIIINGSGNVNQKSTYDLHENTNKEIFNEQTLFMPAFDKNYSVCCFFPSDTLRTDIKIESEDLIQDLQTIHQIIKRNSKEKQLIKLKELIKKKLLSNKCSISIVSGLMNKILKELEQLSIKRKTTKQ